MNNLNNQELQAHKIDMCHVLNLQKKTIKLNDWVHRNMNKSFLSGLKHSLAMRIKLCVQAK